MSNDLVVQDAQFRPVAEPRAFRAEDAIAVHEEQQKFIRGILGDPNRWPTVGGKKTPPAIELNKLWSPLGLESEFLSKNEHGAPGVHREKISEDAKGPIYEFTCTMRVWSTRMGSSTTVEADLSSRDEAFLKQRTPPQTTFLRQRCATRARNTAIRILAGFDVDEMTAAPPETEVVSARSTFQRAKAAGLCSDKATFIAWAKHAVSGTDDMAADNITPRHLRAIERYLDETA